MEDILHTILAKSDQLNAGDLFGGFITVEVGKVTVSKGGDQPISIKINKGYQPYKPCLSMRRVLAKFWGPNSSKWVGEKMTLFCDDSVRWAGKEVGGIRIMRLSGLTSDQKINLRASRSHVVEFTVKPLLEELPLYDSSKIDKNKEVWLQWSRDNNKNLSDIVVKIKAENTLSPEDEQKILNLN